MFGCSKAILSYAFEDNPGDYEDEDEAWDNGRMIERSSLADTYIGFSNVGLSYVGKSNAIK